MKNTKVSYNGQDFYIGIDIHKKRWIVTIITMGLIVKRLSMDPEPKELARYLKKNYPGGKYHTVYEAGFCGFWIDRSLRDAPLGRLMVKYKFL